MQIPNAGIVGIGVDIVDITRIAKLQDEKKVALSKKILSEKELEACGYTVTSQILASRFAAKEAVSKALGTGFRSISFVDISILHNNLGKPFVDLGDKALLLAKSKGITELYVSISHEKNTAIAFCIATGE